ncbi:phosphoribulokinase [Microbulbifer litoralis]|uniref:phosphoribulokinase n=1 Tax=Microbulbifer litoralis TaxID=2933965 RepID=UPI002027A291|nr:phosphoribulokinase [Microbulbifer sp. GX H0434]
MRDSWPEAIAGRAAQMYGELDTAIGRFIAEHQLPDSFCRVIDDYYLPLALWLAGQRRSGQTLVVGLCGGQGSGKSTLTAFLELVWSQLEMRSAGFSLDDIYLTRDARRQLAREVHPLLQTRGVPGTHDVPLGLETIDALSGRRGPGEFAIPLFDKSVDDRAPVAQWPRRRAPVDILLFEGWCVGARPWQNAEAPINALERREDPDGTWRNYVNSQLRGPYGELFGRLDLLLMLKVPDMDCVLEWRRLQERKLRARSGGGMSDDGILRFVQHYERVTRNLLGEMPDRADCVLELGRDHGIAGMRLR